MSQRYADTNALRQVWEPERQKLLHDLDVANRITTKLKLEIETLRDKLAVAQDVIRTKDAIINSHINAGRTAATAERENFRTKAMPLAASAFDRSMRSSAIRALSPSSGSPSAPQLLADLLEHVRNIAPEASSGAVSAAEAYLRSHASRARASSAAPTDGGHTPPPAHRRGTGQGARGALGTPYTPGQASVQENLTWLKGRHPVWRDSSIPSSSRPAFVAGSVSRASSSERPQRTPHSSRRRMGTPGHSLETDSVAGGTVDPLPASRSDSHSNDNRRLPSGGAAAREQATSAQAMRALAANLLAVASPNKAIRADESQVAALADRLVAVAELAVGGGSITRTGQLSSLHHKGTAGAAGKAAKVPPPYVPAKLRSQAYRPSTLPIPARPPASKVVSSPRQQPLHEAQRLEAKQLKQQGLVQEEDEVPPFVVEVGGGPSGPLHVSPSGHARVPQPASSGVYVHGSTGEDSRLQGQGQAGSQAADVPGQDQVPPWMAHLGMTIEEARTKGGVYGPGAAASTASPVAPASGASGPAYMRVPLPGASSRTVEESSAPVRSYGI